MILFFLDFINLLILTSSTLDMKHSRVLLVTTCDKLEIFLEFDISYQKMSEMEGSLDSRLPTLVVRKSNEQ